jgi:short-subunit dehydrogenase
MPTALITGASQGSGKATALLFARNGYDLILAARRQDALEPVTQEIQALGRQALAIPTDVGDAQQVRSLMQKALEKFAQIDVLVNNAGICLTGPVEKTSPEDWQLLMSTNFWGAVNTIQALLPHFLTQGHGVIVNVGSFGGKMPLPYMTAYCASKYAVTGLTEALRLELNPKNIHVCAVHPGVINSNFMERAMFRGYSEAEALDRQQQMQTLLQASWVSQPEEIAQAIWDAIRYRRSEVVVGPTWVATEAHRLFPAAVQWLMQKVGR